MYSRTFLKVLVLYYSTDRYRTYIFICSSILAGSGYETNNSGSDQIRIPNTGITHFCYSFSRYILMYQCPPMKAPRKNPSRLTTCVRQIGRADLVGEMVLDILDGLLAGQPVAGDDGGGVDLLLHCNRGDKR